MPYYELQLQQQQQQQRRPAAPPAARFGPAPPSGASPPWQPSPPHAPAADHRWGLGYPACRWPPNLTFWEMSKRVQNDMVVTFGHVCALEQTHEAVFATAAATFVRSFASTGYDAPLKCARKKPGLVIYMEHPDPAQTQRTWLSVTPGDTTWALLMSFYREVNKAFRRKLMGEIKECREQGNHDACFSWMGVFQEYTSTDRLENPRVAKSIQTHLYEALHYLGTHNC